METFNEVLTKQSTLIMLLMSVVFLALLQFAYTQSTNNQHIDSIYFPNDGLVNSISKRQVINFLNLNHQINRFVDNRQSILIQRQQQFNQSPPNQNRLQSTPPQPIPYPTVQTQTYNYNAITDFAWSVFKGSKPSNPIGNLIMCPILVQLLLSQIESTAAGLTKEEISAVNRHVDPQFLSRLISNIKATKYRNEISLASAIFSAKNIGLNNSFINEAKSQDVSVQSVDFSNTNEALYIINNWISIATKNQIRDLFKPEHLYGLRVLLTNTMYFRGIWRTAFNTTIYDTFDTTDKLHKKVHFMTKIEKLRGSEFVMANDVKGSWVELPYDGNEFSMILIIPEIRHTLDNLIRQFTTDDLLNIVSQLETPHKRLVYLKMPKFSIQSSFSLANVLIKMGLVNLFTIQSQLPYFTNNHEPIAISDILQHTVLNVDEYGTVATSASSVSVVTLSLDGVPRELIFEADQPFLAVIVDKKTRVPLFMAKVYDP